MRVLLVEDSERLQRSVERGLRGSGYAVDVAGDGTHGLWLAETNVYDVVVLDLMLPNLDGLSVLRRLRESGRDVHVLILTAKDTVEDRVKGLRHGADDYLIKPFSLDELLARVEALVRRQHGQKNPRIKVGDLVLDTAARVAFLGNRPIELTTREFGLLELLVFRQGQVLTRTEIESKLYDDRAELMSNVVDTVVYALRKKLDRPGLPSMIQTRRGMGYVFEPAGAATPRNEQ
ncbi:MAG: response regulator transcription factor [Tepidisphaeraceae bacterium]